jgi:hypothetical protein
VSARVTPAGEVVIDYVPQPPMFESTISAFQAMYGGPSISLRIAPDPLGPVNKILSVVRNDRTGSTRVGKSVLYPIRAGSVVNLVHDNDHAADSTLYDGHWTPLHRWGGIDVWAVTVDDKRILEVPHAATVPDVPARPAAPRWRRFRSWATKRARSTTDGLAGRLGYHRDHECQGY